MIKADKQYRRRVYNFLIQQAKDGGKTDTKPLEHQPGLPWTEGQGEDGPRKPAESRISLWQDWVQIWQNAAASMLDQGSEPIILPETGYKCFQGADWENNEVFDFIKQSGHWVRAHTPNNK